MLTALGCADMDGGRTRLAPEANGRVIGELRIGTYNLRVGSAEPAKTVEVIRKMNADVIALQEVRPTSAAMLSRELAGVYPYRHFSSGLGFLSRRPLLRPHFQKSVRGINGWVSVEIDVHQRLIQIVNLHLEPLMLQSLADYASLPTRLQRQRSIQREELAHLLSHLKPETATVVLGDFNRVDDYALDQLGKLGFVDSFASVHPSPDQTATLHFKMGGIPFGRRVDFIFHDHHFQTQESTVLLGHPSDHDAVVSRLFVLEKEDR